MPYIATYQSIYDVRYNGSGSALAKGVAVEFGGTNTTAEWNGMDGDFAITVAELSVTIADAVPENCLGVTMEAIANGARGRICLKGRCQVNLNECAAIAIGDRLVPNASGLFIEATAGEPNVVAVALEAVTTASTEVTTLCWAEVLLPRHGAGIAT
jgi:hypothetical protein